MPRSFLRLDEDEDEEPIVKAELVLLIQSGAQVKVSTAEMVYEAEAEGGTYAIHRVEVGDWSWFPHDGDLLVGELLAKTLAPYVKQQLGLVCTTPLLKQPPPNRCHTPEGPIEELQFGFIPNNLAKQSQFGNRLLDPGQSFSISTGVRDGSARRGVVSLHRLQDQPYIKARHPLSRNSFQYPRRGPHHLSQQR